MRKCLRVLRLLVLLGALFLIPSSRGEAVMWCPLGDACDDCYSYFQPPYGYVSGCQCAWWDSWSHCCEAYCFVETYDEYGNYTGAHTYFAHWAWCWCNP